MSQKRAVVLIAEGSEESEFSVAYDVLVRAGVHTVSVYVPGAGAAEAPAHGAVRCSRGLRIVPDMLLRDAAADGTLSHCDALVLPGGMEGAKTFAQNQVVQDAVRAALAAKRIAALICAAPLLLVEAGIAPHAPVTSHPSIADKLKDAYSYREDPVVVGTRPPAFCLTAADNLITSRGPGTSFAFALAVVEALLGADVRRKVAEPMVLGGHL
ncbi:protein deglycase [Malassezia sp. CBS 17886]|nr:protein deglycase [Malassezia sp. CBS 17886]